MIVCRSARIWHGWYSSVRALTTGPPPAEAMASMRSCPNVRQTIAAAWRPSTRAVSSIGSPRPSWLLPGSHTSGEPPSSATPTENDTRVRVDGLSKRTATVRGTPWGAASGVGAAAVCRVALSEAASASTSACSAGSRSSSLRKCLTVVTVRLRSRSAPRSPARPAMLPGPSSSRSALHRGVEGPREGRHECVDLGVGQDQRRRQAEHARSDRVGQEAGGAQLRLQRRSAVGGEDGAEQRAPPPDPADTGVTEALDAGREAALELLGALEQAFVTDGVEHR